ncbi:MAG TPA: DMT family transporter [Balneolaceae bacterium]|nr:DMT family transporter [Balneolaceae bacterium]
MKERFSNIGTDLSLAFIAVIWALNFTVIKATLVEFDPYTFNMVRFVLAALFMWAVLIRREGGMTIHKKDWKWLIPISILGNLIYQGLFIIGIDLTYAANAAVLLGTIPIWVALFSHLFGVEKINRLAALGIFFAFAGVLLIIMFGKNPISFGSDSFTGDILITLSAIVWGAFTLLTKPFLGRYTPLQFSTFMTTSGAISFILVAIPFYPDVDWGGLSTAAWSGAIYSGLLSIGLAYLIWNNGLKKVGVVRTATYQNLVPVLGLLFGLILLGEALQPLQYLGSAVVIAGILITRRGNASRKETVTKSGFPR